MKKKSKICALPALVRGGNILANFSICTSEEKQNFEKLGNAIQIQLKLDCAFCFVSLYPVYIRYVSPNKWL